MPWFLRVFEQPSGGWTCRRGLEDVDHHADLAQALEHLRALALDHELAEVFVHYADGRVVREGTAAGQA